MDAIIAQNTAKRNLDFGKRAQKSAELSGGVVRLLLVLEAPWKDNATKLGKCQDLSVNCITVCFSGKSLPQCLHRMASC